MAGSRPKPSDKHKRESLDEMMTRDRDHQRLQGKEPKHDEIKREWAEIAEKTDRDNNW